MEICDSCKTKILAGKIYYKVDLKIFTEMVENEDTVKSLTKEDIDKLIDELQNIDSEKLENTVYYKNIFNICHKCKVQFVENPFGTIRKK